MGLTRATTTQSEGVVDADRVGAARLPRAVVLAVAGLVLAALVLALAAGALPGAPDVAPLEASLLFLLLLLGGSLGLEFRLRRQGNRLDLFDAALAVALVSVPGPVLLVLVALAKTCELTVKRVPPVKTCFNVAQWGCAAAAGSLVFAALRDPGPVVPADVAALLAALLVVAALNAAAVQLVLAAVVQAPARAAGVRPARRGIVAGTVGNLVLGLASAALWTQLPPARPVVPMALVAAHIGVRMWAQRRAGSSRLVGLQQASAALAGPDDLRASAGRFVAELQQAFACDCVELRLLPRRALAGLRVSAGCDAGADDRDAFVAAVVERGRALRLVPPDGDAELLALLVAAGRRDCLVAPVRVDGELVGVLCTYDRQGWQGFESAELAVLEAAAAVLAEAVRRAQLADVLRDERAALQAFEQRWRAVARVLELVARESPLPDTLDLVARTLDEQVGDGRCAVLVRSPGQPLVVAAPALPRRATTALERSLLPAVSGRPLAEDSAVHDLTSSDCAVPEPERAALLREGVELLRVWPLPCSPTSGAAGVLVLSYPAEAGAADHSSLADGAARVAALAVEHLLVQHRLAHQANHDALTDLPNRTMFLDRLDHALRSTERDDTCVLVLFLDLDRFKVVNDSLGHRAGDALLCAVAERLRAAVRPGDTVARFGGDEFTMLCEGIEGESHALQVVQRVQAVLKAPFALGESELFATSSIGISLGRGRRQSPETLVVDADAAMYRAKERGGDCFELFDDAMRDRAVRRLAVQSALHRGLERAEFSVVYQPTVHLASGEVDGVEALVRWARPDHGIVQPDEFVPLAEETGLIVPIGAFVLEQACGQARRWHDAAPGGALPSVSVNLSARQLTDPGLVPLVERALERSGVDPGSISLEITETVLLRDVEASVCVLSDLKALGVRLYVDDFGTGYSSLTYLQRFPVDGVKVDRSFVAGLGVHTGDAAIVRGVIGLAHALGLVAIAEGVETQDQLDQLIDLRCDVAQGYFLGRPLPPEQIDLGMIERRAPSAR